MIIRIQGEGQYKVGSAVLDRLNEIDNDLVLRAAEGDEAGFRQLLESMLDWVRSQGESLPVEDLHPSDIILPPGDLEFSEARTMFVDEGLLPG